MKLVMAMSSVAGELKVGLTQERQEILAHRSRAESRARFLKHLIGSVRSTFIFLLIATIGVLVYSHQAEIDSVTRHNAQLAASHVKNHADASRFRQSALSYEKEIDEIAQGSFPQ